MVITVDRDSKVFPPSICDLINIKSQRLNALVDQMIVPSIPYKETIRPFDIRFSPIIISFDEPLRDVETGEVIPGGVKTSNLKIGKMENHSVRIGEVYQINVVFSDIEASTRFHIPNQEDQVVPYFVTEDFYTIAQMDTKPTENMYFRAVPVNPSQEENPAVKNPLGYATLIRILGDSFDMDFKGTIYSKATLPFFNFFIK